MTYYYEVQLWCNRGSSDKVYIIRVFQPEGRSIYRVTAAWGRRGLGAKITDLGEFYNRPAAIACANNQANEKRRKGYVDATPAETGVPSMLSMTTREMNRPAIDDPDDGRTFPSRRTQKPAKPKPAPAVSEQTVIAVRRVRL